MGEVSKKRPQKLREVSKKIIIFSTILNECGVWKLGKKTIRLYECYKTIVKEKN
jgi:hypothetical protein